MTPKLLHKLSLLKRKYAPEGFIIVGIFGSYARNEETAHSDIDILYRCSDKILKKYRGWEFFSYYNKIKIALEQELGKPVDLADQRALNKIGKKYILSELINVS
ncbi:nucleotidyltransferase family protein [Candidatus Venteria ishoeyi]|uniref:Nucleotidyltransferase domain protein n=1 Tax=Candidatus Venteria ishoeyi TaxID=1899563 RepID=A0A1H6FDY9_9GAMM|nr:nucleotidyltransferase domain-containing protein [Candidatus Venteria ishoeyi]MDM8546410.1 nucleotidyltransferase domain-containing protein [Candidatus Venteria ishoeyi]SEH07549.1 Nucleotidyltransferase domain protein [Candidatus Venteria ishoeyi]